MQRTSRKSCRPLLLVLGLLTVFSVLAARTVTDMTVTDPQPRFVSGNSLDGDPGPNVGKPNGADPNSTRSLIEHDIGNLRTTLSNYGGLGNPNSTPTFHGWEWPIRSGNNLLFSAGLWIGAEINGVRRVSTTTDGDNSTGEFWPEHIGTLPASRFVAGSFGDFYVTSKSLTSLNDRAYEMGNKGADDDGDWTPSDDLNHDGLPSENYDAGNGYIGFDDDGDGLIDEDHVEQVNGRYVDVFGSAAGNDTTHGADTDTTGDHLRDDNASYDPEPHVDEDPAGDISHDRIDNDRDGLVDMDDSDADGDLNIGFLDDDNDGKDDEDVNARGVQEYFAAYHDIIDLGHVQAPDADGHVPLRIEVLQRSYAFPEAYAQDFILVDYLIRNIGQLPLEHLYISAFSDPDVGAAGETGDNASARDGNFYDTLSIRADETVPMMEQGKFNFWNGAPTPGVFAIEVVKTPIALGLLRVSFQNFDRLTGGDPATDADKYVLMSSGEIADTSTTAGDKRMVMSFGAEATNGFTLPANSTMQFTLAILSGRDLASVKINARSAYNMYLHDFRGPAAPDPPKFAVDPYADYARIRWLNNSERSVDPFFNQANFEGYIVERSTDQIHWETIAQYDLVDTLPSPFEWTNWNHPLPTDTVVLRRVLRWDSTANDSVTDYLRSDVEYTIYDRNLIPGHTYYYSVRAYSKGHLNVFGQVDAPVLYSGRTGHIVSTTIARTVATEAPTDLKQIYVFPNPYRGSHPGEEGGQINTSRQITEYPRKLFFSGLPANSTAGACMIRIYSLAGDHLATLDHHNGTELEQWDLNTKNQQEIASGIYYYIVEYTPPGGKADRFIDKFVVIK